MGAALAGVISLKSVERQINHQKDEKEKEKIHQETEKRREECRHLINVLQRLRVNLEEAGRIFLELEKTYYNNDEGLTLFQAISYLIDLKTLQRDLENLNINDLPNEYYYSAYKCKLTLVYKVNNMEQYKEKIIHYLEVNRFSEKAKAERTVLAPDLIAHLQNGRGVIGEYLPTFHSLLDYYKSELKKIES